MRQVTSSPIIAFLAAALAASACDDRSAARLRREAGSIQAQTVMSPAAPVAAREFAAEPLQHYLRMIAISIVGRNPSSAEIAALAAAPSSATVASILAAWTKDPAFPASARAFLNVRLGVSGAKNGVNHNLPGNLAAYLARNQLPYAEILAADYCIADDGSKIACDTGAPYTAGVLTTRAFMSTYTSRFNLRRARRLIEGFACLSYPIAARTERRVERSELISMFREDLPEEGTEVGFGNGTSCYTCHSQFALHTQFFVKYDDAGVFQAAATGVQSTTLESGRSTATLFASHFADPARSGSERARILSQDASNLRDAALILSKSNEFIDCAAKSAIMYYLRLPLGAEKTIGAGLLREVRSELLRKSDRPSFNEIVVQSLSHPMVIDSFIQSLSSGESSP